MFYYLKGVVKVIQQDFIVIDVGDVGYKVFMTHADDFVLEDFTKIFVHQVIREDEHFLVGFKELNERDIFMRLIQVKGIGPKTAINVLGQTRPDALINAIANSDVAFLRKLPGIGPKAASQIILDLKGELQMQEVTSKAVKLSSTKSEVKEALKNFGYKASEIDKVIALLDDKLMLEEMLRQALALLRK